MVTPGMTFPVNVCFTAPADEFNSVVLYDEAPAGWQVTGRHKLVHAFCAGR